MPCYYVVTAPNVRSLNCVVVGFHWVGVGQMGSAALLRGTRSRRKMRDIGTAQWGAIKAEKVRIQKGNARAAGGRNRVREEVVVDELSA
jgi:hypothetical protein